MHDELTGETRTDSLSQLVYDRIRHAILDNVYAPGMRLREREVAADLAVSRVPVREAWPRLETAGLIRLDGRRGAVVTHITEDDLIELYDLRSVIEPLAARLAATRIAGEQRKLLDNLLERADDALATDDLEKFTHRNTEIHEMIVDLAGSRLLRRTRAPLEDRTARVNSVTLDVSPQMRHQEHSTLVAAIIKGNAELAASAAFIHVELGRERNLAALQDHPHFRPAPQTKARRSGTKASTKTDSGS